MAELVVVGGGLVGLSTAMLLARDGHGVTVLERDPAPPPEPARAWEGWERRGVNQFRLPHFLTTRFRRIVESELPDVAGRLAAAGALRYDLVANIPDEVKGGPRPGDGDFAVLTGRRPVVEAAVAGAAESTEGVTVRRGVAVSGLRSEPGPGGSPHASGVVTTGGEHLRADLVIDAGGRRSALPDWVNAAHGRAPGEVGEDSGFMYFGRHFRSSDGSIPVMIGPLVQDYGSISLLTLPADNGTWSVVVVTAASDVACRALRDPARWTATVRSAPLAAHWLDGEPLDDGVAIMARIADRRRHFVVDGHPVVTGAVAVGDAWACTNPSLGRGASIGLLHAVALRDLLRHGDPTDPALATHWESVTDDTVGPWYEATNAFDRHRLAEVEADIAGEPYEPDDPFWERVKALGAAAPFDPDLLRAMIGVAGVCVLPDDVFADPDLLGRIMALGGGWREAPPLGPNRADLLAIMAA